MVVRTRVIQGHWPGSPYIGLQFARAALADRQLDRPLVTYDIGVRPPLANADHYYATGPGLIADMKRNESFLPRVGTLRAAVTARIPAWSGVSPGINGGSAGTRPAGAAGPRTARPRLP
jgi:hypothetical protein